MSIFVIKPGILDTIQDLGRRGHGRYGINPGGAMDHFAAIIANSLVGNDPAEGVIEIHFPGPQILFEQDAFIGITGGDFSPTLNKEAIPIWHPILVRKNTMLEFPVHRMGARAYIAVHGGLHIEKWLNSYSTNLKASVGGWHGRRLLKEDKLFFRHTDFKFTERFTSEKNFQLLPWMPDIGNVYNDLHEIHFIKGNEWNELTPDSKEDLLQSNFTIQLLSDRMGYQLKGHQLFLEQNTEMISSAVSFGTMQLLPNGQLILLMADHQTTGGYPRIGHVISAHLPKVAQLRAGDAIQFRPTDLANAERLLFSQQQELHILQRACADHLNKLYADHRP